MTLQEAYRTLGVQENDDLQTIENAFTERCFTISIEPYEPISPEDAARYKEAWRIIQEERS